MKGVQPNLKMKDLSDVPVQSIVSNFVNKLQTLGTWSKKIDSMN